MLMVPLVSVLLPVLTASAARVTLTWARPSSGSVTGYMVFHRYAGQAYNYSQPIWRGGTTTCTISNLPDKTTYFVVRAYHTAVWSSNSKEAIYQPTWALTSSMRTQAATTSSNSLIPTYMTESEGDEVSDSDETGLYGTNPLKADTDGDGMVKVLDSDADSASVPDGEELQDGIDPGGPASKPDLPLEAGRVAADHNWTRVTFRDAFADPIVVAGIVTTNDSAPAVVRIRNLDASGFDVRIQEWDYLDGVHALETVGYLVLERGNYVLPDGTRVEAGRFTTNKTGSFLAMPFSQPFPEAPVVLATVVSADEDDTVTTRVRSISTHNFELRMQEQEGNTQSHATETICYLVWEPSSGSVNGMPFETSLTQDAITQVHETVAFRQSFAHPPVVISGMQTTDDSDTATVRCRNLDRFHVDVRIEEERSGDNETVHTNEVVGYVAVQYP